MCEEPVLTDVSVCCQGKATFDPRFADEVGDLQKLDRDHLRELCRVCHALSNNLDLVKNGSAQCLPRRESLPAHHCVVFNQGDGVVQWVQHRIRDPKIQKIRGSNPACVRSTRNICEFFQSKTLC